MSDTDDVVEILAEGIHRAWMEEKLRQGFADHPWRGQVVGADQFDSEPTVWIEECRVCGGREPEGATQGLDPRPPEAGPKHKHHPNMLGYAQLPEEAKERDRVIVRQCLRDLADYLKRRGEA